MNILNRIMNCPVYIPLKKCDEQFSVGIEKGLLNPTYTVMNNLRNVPYLFSKVQ